MNWQPTFPIVPESLDKFNREVVDRINAIEPKEDFGTTVTDAAGGGKSIGAKGSAISKGVVLQNCVFFDTSTELFFLTDIYTTGRRTVIEPPP